MNKLSKIEYLDLVADEPYIIGQKVGFKDLTILHNEWIKNIMGINSNKDYTLLAHRGSYKTTCLTIAVSLMLILEPNKNIIILRKTDSDVKEVIKQIYKIMNSKLYLFLVKAIYGVDLTFTEVSAFNLNTNLSTYTKGTSQILGLGIKTSITGKHADTIITDDIVNLKDRISKPERELTRLSYMELQNIKNRGGRIVNTGTPWHKEDCISIMPNVHKYDCYQTNLITRDKLEQIRGTMSPSLFCANYELKHIADSECMFTNPIFTKDNDLILGGVAHIDASYGGTDGTAFTILKQYGDKFIVFGMRWNKHVDDCLNIISNYMRIYKAGTIYCERNADKGYLAKELRNRRFIANDYQESMNKFIKISTYLKKNWDNITFLECTSPEYINEILDYTENAPHDDSPDSLASLLRQITKGTWLY